MRSGSHLSVLALVLMLTGCSAPNPEAHSGPAAAATTAPHQPAERPTATLAPTSTVVAERPPPASLPAPSDLEETPPPAPAEEPTEDGIISPGEYRYAVLGQAAESARGVPPATALPAPPPGPGEQAAAGGGFTGGEGGSQFLRNFTAVFVDSVGDRSSSFDTDEAEARCMANAFYEALGEARLAELGSGPDGSGVWAIFDGAAGFTPSERAVVTAAIEACVPDVLSRLTGGNSDYGRCVREVLAELGIGLEQILFSEVAEYEEPVALASLEVWARCGEPAG